MILLSNPYIPVCCLVTLPAEANLLTKALLVLSSDVLAEVCDLDWVVFITHEVKVCFIQNYLMLNSSCAVLLKLAACLALN